MKGRIRVSAKLKLLIVKQNTTSDVEQKRSHLKSGGKQDRIASVYQVFRTHPLFAAKGLVGDVEAELHLHETRSAAR